MDKKEFLAQMEAILEAEDGTLAGGKPLTELARWDSLCILGVIALAEEKFGVGPSPERFAGLETLDDVWDLIRPDA